MTNIVGGHDLDTQSGRADYRAAGGQVEGNASGGYSYSGAGGSGSGGGSQTPTQGAQFNTPSGGGGGTGGGGGSTGAATPAASDGGLNALGAAISGVTASQLAQQKQEFDAQLQFARDQMTQLGIPQLQINQALAALQQKAFDLQVGQAMGTYQGAPTEAAKEFQQSLNQQMQQFQQTLGQQYLATAAQLQGPQNTFQLSNYMRGAQGNPNVPTYLQSLANNTGMAAFQGPGTTPPTANTMAGVAQQMSGQTSATPGWDYAQTLGTMQGIQNRGAQALAPGALERLTPEELQAFGSGLGAVGGSLPSFLQQYQQSRIGQSATPQTALA